MIMTWEEAAQLGNVDCIVDGANGIYVPQRFATMFDMEAWGVDSEQEAILLAGPDHEHYWEAWDEVTNEARWTDSCGHEWILWQDGDLFAVRADVEIDSKEGAA